MRRPPAVHVATFLQNVRRSAGRYADPSPPAAWPVPTLAPEWTAVPKKAATVSTAGCSYAKVAERAVAQESAASAATAMQETWDTPNAWEVQGGGGLDHQWTEPWSQVDDSEFWPNAVPLQQQKTTITAAHAAMASDILQLLSKGLAVKQKLDSGASPQAEPQPTKSNVKKHGPRSPKSQSKQPVSAVGEFCNVVKHSSMGCAVIDFLDVRVRNAILDHTEVYINELCVELKAHTREDIEVPTSIFAAWGRQVEKDTPLPGKSLAVFFDSQHRSMSLTMPVMRTTAEGCSTADEPDPEDEDSTNANHEVVGNALQWQGDSEAASPSSKPTSSAARWLGMGTDDAVAPSPSPAAPSVIGSGGDGVLLCHRPIDNGAHAGKGNVTQPLPPASAVGQGGSVRMVAVRSYTAEADGCLDISVKGVVDVMGHTTSPGGDGFVWPSYVFAVHDEAEAEGIATPAKGGWLPEHILWKRFVNSKGRAWLQETQTGAWTWEDELEADSSWH